MSELYRRLHFWAGNGWRLLTLPWRQRFIAPEEARSIFGCSFGADGWHHLRSTLEEYDADPDVDYRDTSLFRYLTTFTPQSVCDISPGARERLPLFVYPWGTFRKGETTSNKDAARSRFCGPSSDEFVAEEFRRTIELYLHIKRVGYRPWKYGNTFIGGTFLYGQDGRRRFVVLQGNHRLAVLAHAGYRRIAVRDCTGYLAHVDEAEIGSWPLVGARQCSATTAKAVFDLFFDQNGRHVLERLESPG